MGLSNELSCEAGSFSCCHLNPHRCFQRFEDLFPHPGTLGCVVCLAPQLFLPVYLHMNVGPPSLQFTASLGPPAAALPALVHQLLPCCESFLSSCLSPPLLPDECFIFNSLVVILPYSSIFSQFWLFFVFKFVVVLLVVRGGTVCLPMPPSWPSVLLSQNP